MKRALFSVLAVALVASTGGCKLCHHLHTSLQRHAAGHDGCHTGCQDGACQTCGPHAAGACPPGGPCPDGSCQHCPPGYGPHDVDGHTDPNELFYHGHDGPPERVGLLAWLSAVGGNGDGDGMGSQPGGPMAQPAPPPSAAGVSYPYYTTRGPRDFLSPNPRGIGP